MFRGVTSTAPPCPVIDACVCLVWCAPTQAEIQKRDETIARLKRDLDKEQARLTTMAQLIGQREQEADNARAEALAWRQAYLEAHAAVAAATAGGGATTRPPPSSTVEAHVAVPGRVHVVQPPSPMATLTPTRDAATLELTVHALKAQVASLHAALNEEIALRRQVEARIADARAEAAAASGTVAAVTPPPPPPKDIPAAAAAAHPPALTVHPPPSPAGGVTAWLPWLSGDDATTPAAPFRPLPAAWAQRTGALLDAVRDWRGLLRSLATTAAHAAGGAATPDSIAFAQALAERKDAFVATLDAHNHQLVEVVQLLNEHLRNAERALDRERAEVCAAVPSPMLSFALLNQHDVSLPLVRIDTARCRDQGGRPGGSTHRGPCAGDGVARRPRGRP